MFSRLVKRATPVIAPKMRVVVTAPRRALFTDKTMSKEELKAEEEAQAKLRAEIERQITEKLSEKGDSSAKSTLIKRVFIGLGITLVAHAMFHTYAVRAGVFDKKDDDEHREILEENMTQMVSPAALEVMKNSPELLVQMGQKKEEAPQQARMYKVNPYALMEQLEQQEEEQKK